MGIIDTLKWLWDPRTDEEKARARVPLQNHFAIVKITFEQGLRAPAERQLEWNDFNIGDMGAYRYDPARDVQRWIDGRMTKGVNIDGVRYSPHQIVSIEVLKTWSVDQ